MVEAPEEMPQINFQRRNWLHRGSTAVGVVDISRNTVRDGGRWVAELMISTDAAWISIILVLSKSLWAPFLELGKLLAMLLVHVAFSWSMEWFSVIASTARVL
eukprot:5474473-Ditylum_brightwellii.AAC.1